MNGKVVTNIDLSAAVAEHRARGALATLVLKENVAREHFSIVDVDARGRITRFAGFPEPEVSEVPIDGSASQQTVVPIDTAPLMFTGIQVLSPEILEYVPRSRFSHSTVDVYPPAIRAGEPIIAHISNADWFEMSTLNRYLEANLRLMRNDGRSMIAGQDCVVADGATVEESVLWDRVSVGQGAHLNHVVLGDDVQIPAGAVVERAVVVRRSNMREVERGEVRGDNIIVPI